MPVYYLRTGAPNTAGTVNLNSTSLWAQEVAGSPPPANTPGTLSPTYTDTNNEFVIDINSGGTATSTATALQLTVTSNLTIANLSFGDKNTNTTPDRSTRSYLNISAAINLIVTGNLQLASGFIDSGVGAVRLNTNNTGKLVIQGNLFLGVHSTASSPLGLSYANFSVDGGQKSIIEFSGASVCQIKTNSIGTTGGSTAAYLTFNAPFSAPSTSSIEIQFNKSTLSNPAFLIPAGIVVTGIRFYNPTVNNTFTVNSNYDSTTASAQPSRYNAPGFLNFSVLGNGPLNFTSDSKEIIFSVFEYKHSIPITFINSISSFKVENISNIVSPGAKGYIIISSNSIVEVYKNLTLSNTTQLGSTGVVRGLGGTIKFVGTTDSTITTNSTTESISYNNPNGTGFATQCFSDVNIEINKTSGAKLIIANNVTDLNISRFLLHKDNTTGTPTFIHTSGQIICNELLIFGLSSATAYYSFTGNSTFNTGDKILLSVNTKISIDSTILKTNTLEMYAKIQSGNAIITPSANLYSAIILGNRGFTVNNYIHTSSTSNSLGVINVVTLSNNISAVYTVNNSIEMLGLSTRRAILKGDSNPTSIINLPSTSASSTTLTTTTSPSLTTRHYVSQNPINTGLNRRTPSPTFTGSDITLQSSFAKIIGGSTNTWTLNRNVGTITSRGFEAGIPAVFNYNGLLANLNINYVSTFDIDSSAGTTTIKADNSYQNRIGIPNPNLWRTVNWDSLNPLTPLVTVAYVE